MSKSSLYPYHSQGFNSEEALAVLALQLLDGFHASHIYRLYRQLGSFQAILGADSADPQLDLTEKGRAAFQQLQHHHQSLLGGAEKILAQCHAGSIYCIPLGGENYPDLLQEISLPPLILFAKGDIQQLSLPQIAVVGSRNASTGGLDNAYQMAQYLSQRGFVITSGLALGIDGAAHRGAVSTGKTVAVLGTGVDVIYPRRHAQLYEEIVANGGCIVSEFLPGTAPRAANFPRRNRLISGLSVGVLVVEAALKSGSLITAKSALDQGREVFAIPGSIHNPLSKGGHQLIKQGATLVETAADIVDELGSALGLMDTAVVNASTDTQEHCSSQSLGDDVLPSDTQSVLNAMGFDPVDVDALVTITQLPIPQLTQALTVLELQGVVSQSNGWFQRIK